MRFLQPFSFSLLFFLAGCSKYFMYEPVSGGEKKIWSSEYSRTLALEKVEAGLRIKAAGALLGGFKPSFMIEVEEIGFQPRKFDLRSLRAEILEIKTVLPVELCQSSEESSEDPCTLDLPKGKKVMRTVRFQNLPAEFVLDDTVPPKHRIKIYFEEHHGNKIEFIFSLKIKTENQ